MDFTEVPMGFGMALAMNEPALNAYAAMTEQQKQAVLRKAQNARSRQEMQIIVGSLIDPFSRPPLRRVTRTCGVSFVRMSCFPGRIRSQSDKLAFVEVSVRPEQHCHSEPVRKLVWESPSNSGQPIVIHS